MISNLDKHYLFLKNTNACNFIFHFLLNVCVHELTDLFRP